MFVWRLENMLDLYKEPYDPAYQLISETRQVLPPELDQPARIDDEYRREGSRNLFMCFEPSYSWRYVEVTNRRTAHNWVQCMKVLVDVHVLDATLISVVQGNLNTHTLANLYAVFPPAEARRITNRLDFRYTPKHGSWSNMAESECAVLQC